MRTSKAVSSKIKTPKVYSEDGLIFKSRDLLNFYRELKAQRENGLIESFELPTVDKTAKKSKYGANKCVIDDKTFDSIMEGKFYLHLREEQERGEVDSFEIHPKYILQDGFTKNGKKVLPIHYVSDFLVRYVNGEEIVYDVKGMETADFKLKRKMFDFRYRDHNLMCVQYRATQKAWLELKEIEKLKKEKRKGEKI